MSSEGGMSVERLEEVKKDMWLIQSSSIYAKELSECTSPWAEEMRKFVGEKEENPCDLWKDAVAWSEAWEKERDWKAAAALVDLEKYRRKIRQISLLHNDVWRLRSKPPKDFNKPLPKHLISQLYNDSKFLYRMDKDIQDQRAHNPDFDKTPMRDDDDRLFFA